MKQSILGVIAIGLALVALVGCSKKLDTDGANRILTRFVAENEYVRKHSSNTGVLGSVGPIVVTGDQATIEFTIEYREYGNALKEGAVATFSRTQDGKWILSQVRGNKWGLGWWTEPSELNWEVK